VETHEKMSEKTNNMNQKSSETKLRRELVGYKNFKPSNPRSDKFGIHRFHSIEFWCQDAKTSASRFAIALGMKKVAKIDQMSAGKGSGSSSRSSRKMTSYVLRTNELVFCFSAPLWSCDLVKDLEGDVVVDGGLSDDIDDDNNDNNNNNNNDNEIKEEINEMNRFIEKHGLAVKRVCLKVDDVDKAMRTSEANGARVVKNSQKTMRNTKDGYESKCASVELYGDVELRFVEDQSSHLDSDEEYRYLDYDKVVVEVGDYSEKNSVKRNFGIKRLDHCVGNVHDLIETVEYIEKMLGFHEFAEFVAADVGTVDSGLNSMVLANNDEFILLPINEPTFGTRRKSQIQTYLEANNGPGVQHLALKTDDIIDTVTEMKKYSGMFGGFDFQPPASETYYKNLKEKVGDALSEEMLKKCEELGLLVDKDDQGILIQVFTKPLTDRPTIFIEIIQRIGCEYLKGEKLEQSAGCGGFGKGNFAELFKSIENYEKGIEDAQKQM
jgi:4-hydroxyphenylpyruvate dioxygenase